MLHCLTLTLLLVLELGESDPTRRLSLLHHYPGHGTSAPSSVFAYDSTNKSNDKGSETLINGATENIEVTTLFSGENQQDNIEVNDIEKKALVPEAVTGMQKESAIFSLDIDRTGTNQDNEQTIKYQNAGNEGGENWQKAIKWNNIEKHDFPPDKWLPNEETAEKEWQNLGGSTWDPRDWSSFTQMDNPSSTSLSETVQMWREYRNQCLRHMSQTPFPEGEPFCNRTFDEYACWPDGIPGMFVNVSCPWYLPWAKSVSNGRVYRYCTAEGKWLHTENSTIAWRDLSECEEHRNLEQQKQLLLLLSVTYTTGYSLSFSALVIATFILLGFRHLHCTRNYIHLNLFTSFILRAVSVFIKDSVLKWMYNPETFHQHWDELISYQESLSCKLVFMLMQYCVAANYYWLLVEGIYLHTLLAFSVFSEQRAFRTYLLIGWGVPLLFVIPWGIVKHLYEDTGCWTRNYNMNYWLIIRLPILGAIGVNFLIFVRVICIIISKLQANLMCQTDMKCRLAKSTLTLIPLLGTHEVIFAFILDENAKGMLRYVKLFFELFFTSFQGLVVAILYCFVNNEVQAEVRKRWQRWRLEHIYRQRENSMKPLNPTFSLNSGGTSSKTYSYETVQL
ncbi:glucagon-like peptide 1 receptor [Protopterus annectens]|uniref:glucagon-like peptide 1 receptor n=1 Tax=Protopterus annectens TaxID=7888 RepID=UPI001CFA02BE|nr:glucagon-like peptide 1 receptor [Protopterus annectens]